MQRKNPFSKYTLRQRSVKPSGFLSLISLGWIILSPLQSLADANNTLSLPQSIQLALKNHPDIIQASRTLALAELTFTQSRQQWQPTLEPVYQQTLFAEDKTSFNTSTGIKWDLLSGGSIQLQNQFFYDYNYVDVNSEIFDYDNTQKYQLQTSLSGQLPLLGSNKNQALLTHKQAKISIDQAKNQFVQTVQQVLIETLQTYRRLISLDQQSLIEKKHLAQARKNVILLQKEVKNGKKARNTLSEAEAQILQFELDEAKREHEQQKVIRQFKRNLKIPSHKKIQLKQLSENTPSINLSKIPYKNLLHTHPDLNLQRKQLALNKAQHPLDVTRSDLQATLQGRVEFNSKTTTQASLSLQKNLNPHIQKQEKKHNSLKQLLDENQFIQNCVSVVEKIEDLSEDLRFEKRALELQKKKLELDKAKLQATQKKYSLGLVAAVAVNEELEQLNKASQNWLEKNLSLQNKFDQYLRETGEILHHYIDFIPENMRKKIPKYAKPLSETGLPDDTIENLCRGLLSHKDCGKP